MQRNAESGMPLDEFIRLYDVEGPFELVNGQRKRMPNAAEAGHGEIIEVLYITLYMFAASKYLGKTLSETPFVCVDAGNPQWVIASRIPNVMYYSAKRLDAYKLADPEWKKKPYILIPDLVIEVLSPKDELAELERKADQYLQDGVRAVWVVDPQTQTIVTHLPNTQPTRLHGSDMLSGGDIIPGFEIVVASIFA